MTDSDLLREYAKTGSGVAFAELVGRHVDWAHSVAMRHVRDRHLAEDVTQVVFVALASKASSLHTEQSLSPWLFRVARNVSCAVLRTEKRRERREQEAARMAQDQPAELAGPRWQELAGTLDELVERLGARDRQAVLLRFYQRQSLAEVGAALGVSADAARKCTDRRWTGFGRCSRSAGWW